MSDCTVCGKALYPGCMNVISGGGGHIFVATGNKLTGKTCPNMKSLILKNYLISIDPLLETVPYEINTPIYEKDKVDYTLSNTIFSSAPWETVLRYFKWPATLKSNSGWVVKTITDATLVNVYVGNTSAKIRTLEQKEEGLLVANSVEDLVSVPDLLIIRLGMLKHYNRAAANILHEAITLRMSLNKPTWLVEPHDRKFEPYTRSEFHVESGMVCCNTDVANLVQSEFHRISFKPQEEEVYREKGYTEEGDNITVGPTDILVSEEIAIPDNDDMEQMLQRLDKKSKAIKKRKYQ